MNVFESLRTWHKSDYLYRHQSLEAERVKIDAIVKHSGSPQAFAAKVLGELTNIIL